MKLDKDSYGTMIKVCLAVLLVAAAAVYFIPSKAVSIPIAAVLLAFCCFVVYFHRVPVRNAVGNDRIISSVADGKVVILKKAFEKEYLNRECIQVSIYMDFFDVHANFWPMTGEVTYYKYHPGKYLLAFKEKSSEENEHSSTALKSKYGEIFFKQIAGTFARRIVCYSKKGAIETAGKQCGIIKFGSRIDMFLPLDADIKVKIGDTTRACETVIAELKG